MMDFNERTIPGISANYLLKESQSRYNFALQFLRNTNSRILDIGCGTGYGSEILSKKGKVYGIDYNSEAITFAKNHYKKYGKFLVGDIRDLKFKKNNFDLICSFEVIEHLTNPIKYLLEASRVLKKDGVFVLSTPNKLYPKLLGETKSVYHKHEYKAIMLEQLLNKYFNVVSLFGQRKSPSAKSAYLNFLKSQNKRQFMVNIDKLNVRSLLSKKIKEYLWRKVSFFVGAYEQNKLTINDFVFDRELSSAEYLIVVCKKK